jgi:hypothetical protein
MTDNVENVILEYLRSMRADISAIKHETRMAGLSLIRIENLLSDHSKRA